MKKKNRKILIQTAIYITLVFIIGAFVCVYGVVNQAINVMLKSEESVLNDKLSFLNDQLSFNGFEKTYHKLWLEDPEYMQQELTQEETNALLEFEEGLNNENFLERYNKLSDETKKLHAKECYYIDSMCVESFIEQNNLASASLFILDKNGTATFELFHSTEKNVNDNYYLGKIHKFNPIRHKGIKKLLNNDYKNITYEITYNGFKNEPLCFAYLPKQSEEDGSIEVLCIGYRWSSIFSEESTKHLNSAAINVLIGFFIADILVLLFLYLKAIRPLNMVKKAMRLYIKNKDSEEAQRRTSKIKTRNELGVLADDVSTLAVALDKYSQDNLNLAKEKERVSIELNLASEIQDNMLKKDFPYRDDFILYASMNPAKEVGGDFYDFYMVDNDHLCMTIADVSGKGIPASLVMMSALTSIRNYSKLIHDPSQILEKINNDLCNRNIDDMFVTVWLGILDLNTGILTTSNAGHEYPAVNTTGKFELFQDRHGFVIGGMEGMKYVNETIQLKNGDTVFVYTDGVPESTNSENKLFGNERMLEVLNEHPDDEPSRILNSMKSSTAEFSGEAPQFDDLTMLCVRYLGRG